MSSKPILPPTYASNPMIEIAWNGWYRKQCEQKGTQEKHKECVIILSLVYDPWLKRLRPIESSQK